jgi:hypothetical protein
MFTTWGSIFQPTVNPQGTNRQTVNFALRAILSDFRTPNGSELRASRKNASASRRIAPIAVLRNIPDSILSEAFNGPGFSESLREISEFVPRDALTDAEVQQLAALGYRPPAPAACSPVVPKQISQPIAVM